MRFPKYLKFPACALFCALIEINHGKALGQSTASIDSLDIVGGKFNIGFAAPTGEYTAECTENLGSDQWVQLSRLYSDGSAQQFDDPLDPVALRKFYRIVTVPPANEFHLTGEFAVALEAALVYSDLQATFGLTFPQGEAVLPAGNDLSFSSINSRIYAAVIASLSKLAKDVSDSFPEGSRPTAATIAAAFANDISDGSLDGKNSGVSVPVGATGFNLPAYSGQDFIDALDVIKAEIPGLYNVVFTAPVASSTAPKSDAVIAMAASGSFTPSAPAVWGNFYWDSSEWQ